MVMFKFLTLGAAALASLALVPTAADARDHYRGGYHGDHYRGDRGYYRDYGRYNGPRYRGYRGGRGYYASRGYYGGGQGYYRGGRGYCRDRGNGGTVIGAIAGGLLGNEVAGRRGDRTLGTIVGAGVGAVAGRAIDRNC
jgi:hypothetical protein